MRVNAPSVLEAFTVRRQEGQLRLESVSKVNIIYQNLNIIKSIGSYNFTTLILRVIKASSSALFIDEKKNEAK